MRAHGLGFSAVIVFSLPVNAIETVARIKRLQDGEYVLSSYLINDNYTLLHFNIR